MSIAKALKSKVRRPLFTKHLYLQSLQLMAMHDIITEKEYRKLQNGARGIVSEFLARDVRSFLPTKRRVARVR